MRRLVIAIGLLQAGVCVSGQQAEPVPHGTVIFERSDSAKPAEEGRKSGSDNTVKSEMTDADRAAVTFTRYDLDVRLQPERHGLEVRARITVRNDGDHPLGQLPLQLSSSLTWEQVRIVGPGGRLGPARFLESALDSDIDHTGKLNEAAVVLPGPLAPGATLSLDVIYSGRVARSAARLEAIGAPAGQAAQADWDEIAPEFVGLRGFGDVAWYPVASVPVRLGDGDRIFAQIGAVKLREQAALVSMRVSVEAAPGAVPNVAVLNGVVTPLDPVPGTGGDPDVPALATCALPEAPLGFQTLSLLLAQRERVAGDALDVYVRPGEQAGAQPYLQAGASVAPLLTAWLGNRLHPAPSIVALPEAEDAPFEERETLWAGLRAGPADQVADGLANSLTHAWFRSPRPWLDEGVANFMAVLWTAASKASGGGQDAALTQLNAQRGALALAEPANGASAGSLLTASDAIFYRTKATYVLWMLRSITGDEALQAALKAYDPAADTTDGYFEGLLVKAATAAAAKKPKPAAGDAPADPAQEVHALFEDWVYHDRGLPDLSITGLYPSKAGPAHSYLVAVNVANSGGAVADVPVTVTSGTSQVTERMLVPAHGEAVRRILIEDAPVQVRVNDGTVPEAEASEHVERIHYTEAVTP